MRDSKTVQKNLASNTGSNNKTSARKASGESKQPKKQSTVGKKQTEEKPQSTKSEKKVRKSSKGEILENRNVVKFKFRIQIVGYLAKFVINVYQCLIYENVQIRKTNSEKN